MIEGTILLILLIGIVILNPVGDAIRDNGNKRKQKNLEILRDFLFFLIIAIVSRQFTFFVLSGISYLIIRISIHNPAYNFTRKPRLPWYYTGTTSLSDDLERKYLGEKSILKLIIRILAFLFGVFIFYLGVKSL